MGTVIAGLAYSREALPPGRVIAGFYADAVGRSDPQLNIKPPGEHNAKQVYGWRHAFTAEEQLTDVMASLNVLLKVEGDVHKRAAKEFVRQQRELQSKARMRMRDAAESI